MFYVLPIILDITCWVGRAESKYVEPFAYLWYLNN
jgi:hypothetical protein